MEGLVSTGPTLSSFFLLKEGVKMFLQALKVLFGKVVTK